MSQIPTARVDNRFEVGESLAILLIFGLGFSGIAWVATRGVAPAFHPVERPREESLAVLGYLALFALLVLGYGFSWIKDSVSDGPLEDTALLVAKLVTMVLVPTVLFARFGSSHQRLIAELAIPPDQPGTGLRGQVSD